MSDDLHVSIAGFRGPLSQAVILGLVSLEMLEALGSINELEQMRLGPEFIRPASAIDRAREDHARAKAKARASQSRRSRL